ncbi:fatty acyl-AMP ligase [Plantactinospora siamensis]|uniref:Fatty acyl-AMP ligase n=1 Tax=Plantactinospora siamensis TaxID=555372 RepID=A0ABV6NWL5_9ACTN
MLRYRAETAADREAFVYVGESGAYDAEQRLTFGQLDAAARQLGGWLSAHLPASGAGRRVLLLYPPGLDFLVAYFGCLYAGAVAVPAPLPEGPRIQQERVMRILADCGANLVLTDAPDRLPTLPDAPQVVATASTDVLTGQWQPPRLRPGSLAMLQYTSGSTSSPRGVLLSHDAMLANLALTNGRLRHDEASRLVTWLPFYHDMGLTQVLSMVYVGGWAAVMSPTAFLKRPHRWLELISHYRASTATAPNFGYDLCARRVTDEQLTGVDLSSWTAALNGSEPVSAAALDAFTKRFEPYGFRHAAHYPCYGMAEATVFVSGGDRDTAPVIRHVVTEQYEANRLVPAEPGQHTRPLVGCGTPVDYDVRIVDPDSGRTLPPGAIGEIWLRGPSIGAGYWGRPVESAATFDARTADGDGGYLRTGDLGALLDGELFVTGRRKEMLVVHGRNLYPYDIEAEVRRLDPALGQTVGAVFAVGTDDQRVAVVHEVRGQLDSERAHELAAAIRELVTRNFGVAVGAVALLRPGQVPRTTSGKIQRGRTRELFLAGQLGTLHEESMPGLRPADDSSGARA